MSKRIDHARKANEALNIAQRFAHTAGTSDAGQFMNVLIAQAEATLAHAEATHALVEQQRIANLLNIACGTKEGSMSRVARDLAYMALIENGPDGMLRPEVAAALRIKEEK